MPGQVTAGPLAAKMLRLKVIWKDVDLIECHVEGESAEFKGSADIYFTDELLLDLASKLEQFPRSRDDERTFSRRNGDGMNSFALGVCCVDGLGHAAASVEIVDAENAGEAVRLVFPTAASSVDRFVQELREMALQRDGRATLGEE